MQLNFKPTKVPVYEKGDSAGIPNWWRVGTIDSTEHYKVRKNGVTFRVIRVYHNEENIYTLYIEHSKRVLIAKRVASFEDGFDKANEWAKKHLKDKETLEKFLRDNAQEEMRKRLEKEAVNTLEEAQTIKFPYGTKYAEELIHEVMEKDLNYCVAYYAYNTNDYYEFVLINTLSSRSRECSSSETKACNAIKLLLDHSHPAIAKDIEGYFEEISLDEAKSVIFASGKYEGKTLEEVWSKNPGYIQWYLENVDTTIHNLRLMNAMRLLRKSL